MTLNKNHLVYFMVMVLYGTTGLVSTYLSVTSYEKVFIRTLIGSITLLVILILQKKKLSFFHYKKESCYLLIGAVGYTVAALGLFEAYEHIGVSSATLIYYCAPIIVILLSPLLFQEKLTLKKILAIIIVLVGILLVNGVEKGQKLDTTGVLLSLAAALGFASFMIFSKKIPHITGLENSLCLMSFCAAASLLLVLVLRGGIHITLKKSDIVPALVIGVINTGIAGLVYYTVIPRISAQMVALGSYLEPVAAVILAFLVLHEKMNIFQWIGGAFIVGGAILCEMKDARDKRTDKKKSRVTE